MNIAKIMIPKVSTVFLHENNTIRQGVEQFMRHGYTAIPVLNEKEFPAPHPGDTVNFYERPGEV